MSLHTSAPLPQRPYHGWLVVAGLFLVLTVSSGFGFYNMSVYMNVLAARTGHSVSALSVAVSLFFVVGGVAGIWVAALLERFDVRWVMIAGAALAGVSLGSTAHAPALWQLYGLYVLFGIGNSAVSIVTSTALVTRWFPGRNRSVALSVASTGLSMGGVLLTPLTARLFNELSVTTVMPWLGFAFFALIVPVVLGLFGRQPDGRDGAGGNGRTEAGWGYREAVRSRFFRLVTAAYVLCMGAQVGGIAHLYNRTEGLFGFAVAASAVQVLTVMSILFRLVGGVLVTRISIRAYVLGNLLGQAVGLGVVAWADTAVGALTGAGLFGATVGNLLMLHPLWLAEAFGVRAYPRIFSLSNAITVLGVAGGPVLLGLIYDWQDYRVAYFAATGLSLVAWVVMFAAGPTPPAEATADDTES
ncbi:MAG: MFS transporter [Pseudomonadales bacterium]